MCADGRCTFPARAGQDIDINGDVWPGSELAAHLAETKPGVSETGNDRG